MCCKSQHFSNFTNCKLCLFVCKEPNVAYETQTYSGSCLLAVDSGNMAVILLKYLPADPSITSTKYPVVSTIQPEQHVHVIEEK